MRGKRENHFSGKSRAAAGFLVLALAIGSVGCGSGGREELTLSASTRDFIEGAELRDTGTGLEVPGTGDFSEIPVAEDFRQSYADFSLRLLRESRREENHAARQMKNMMVSPLSAMLALEMTRSGARGETEAEMAEVLYGELPSQEGRDQLLSFLQNLSEEELHFANSIWFRTEGIAFEPEETFLENAAEAYEAGIYGAPFDENTVEDINNWVKHETDGMIEELLTEIPDRGVMYLLNALAFDAAWSEEYEKDDVREAEFYLENGEVRTVDMMYSQEDTYLSEEMATGFLKDYKSGYAFLALLPREGVTVDDYLEQLTGEKLVELVNQSQRAEVRAGLPKFTAKTSLDLNQVLKAMGMALAFDETRADLTGMGRSEHNLYVSRVSQKTFVEVDESGTRAAAVTSVEPADGAEPPLDPAEPKTVILDRPFVYGIVDTYTGLPLFLGIVDAPEA